MAGNVEVKVVGEERFKLESEQAPLGKHSAVLLDAVAEVAHQGMGFAHNSLAEKCTHLGATDVKDVGKASNVRERNVASRAGKTVPQASTVNKEGKFVLSAHLVECF